MGIVSQTFKSASNGIFVNDVEYPKNMWKAIYSNSTVRIEYFLSSAVLVPETSYDQIKNGDTGSMFASMDDLRTYIDTNFYK